MRIVNDIAVALATYLEEDTSDVVMNLASPPRPEMGDVAFPCFRLAKRFRKSPHDIANNLKKHFEADECSDTVELLTKIDRIETAGGYLNFFIRRDFLAQSIMRESIESGGRPGKSCEGEGKTVIVEYSSPNIAKPFHVGHGFSTFLGEAIANLYEYAGYKVERFNHLGDYGTQFGKLIVAWKLWGDIDALEASPIDELTRIYVKFHDVAETKPELEDEARAAFGRLEQGGKEETTLWQRFRDVSLREFNRIYERVGIHFDNTNGESFYSPLIAAVVDELEKKNLLVESDGAHVVNLEEFDLNPCLILKSDGSTIYASRDIASIFYRRREYNFDRNIYVVGIPQKNHFNQVFAVVEKMGFPNPESNVHVAFGTVKFADGAFSTRTGNVIILEDLLDTSVAKTRAIIETNNPTMEPSEIDGIAEKIGVGAVRYTFLRNGRERDIVFSWDDVLDFEGDSAPYLLYTVTRCVSLERKAPESLLERADNISDGELGLLVSDEEQELLKEISRFPHSVLSAREAHEPSVIMRQIMAIARSFNTFYHNAQILRAENEALGAARLVLAQAVGRTISAGLRIAGIEPVEKM
ncbi:MAG TPA: arginine--tRNA ligase [Clostridiaceae bacterium]|nr:arginine--tRNA ligase [Clostridiaceae bacterium]